ncbi:MAG: BREX-2 system adenine-specific DNA-methyltransferase PglX [Desulfococcaceae bacterium]
MVSQYLWIFRNLLEVRTVFGKTLKEKGSPWWEHLEHYKGKLLTKLSLVFAFVATHNHFVMDRGDKIFNRSAPVIKLSSLATEEEHMTLLGLLNSSTACFWMKQVFTGKHMGDGGVAHASREGQRFEFDSTKLKQFPLPVRQPLDLPKKIDGLARELQNFSPSAIATKSIPTPETIENAKTQAAHRIAQMIALQEELDWQCYGFYGLLDKDESAALVHENPPEIALGQRAFEIVMARQMAAGELETTWFQRHNSTPVTEIPAHWPKDYRELVERRIQIIAENPRTIGLIEKPEYKRRWNLEPWDRQLETALRNWLLDRLESYFDFDGRMNDAHEPTQRLDGRQLATVARLADIARADEDFMNVAERYRNRADFDVPALVGELVNAETVPLLPACRYKPAGLDKRAAWERTWKLQRLEDAIDGLFDLPRLLQQRDETLPPDIRREIEAVQNQVLSLGLLRGDDLVETKTPAQWLEDEVQSALESVRANRRTGDPETDPIFKDFIENFAHNAKQTLVGDIPVPPKYAGKDFQHGHFWRLRGKLDVPKERWIGFPHCEGEDQSAVVAWAGCDHLQLAQAVSTHFVHIQEVAGGSRDPRLEILLAGLLELLPWIKQWHNDLDLEFNLRMGDFFEDFIAEEARRLDKTTAEIAGWKPPKTKPKKKKSKTPARKTKGKGTPA